MNRGAATGAESWQHVAVDFLRHFAGLRPEGNKGSISPLLAWGDVSPGSPGRPTAVRAQAGARPARRRLERELLSLTQAAAMLGVSRNKTLHEMLRRGELRSVRVNG